MKLDGKKLSTKVTAVSRKSKNGVFRFLVGQGETKQEYPAINTSDRSVGS